MPCRWRRLTPVIQRQAAGFVSLNRWAKNRAIGTENTAIARQGFQQSAATAAVVEIDASILRHFSFFVMPASGQIRIDVRII
jgi:hypothetical protein